MRRSLVLILLSLLLAALIWRFLPSRQDTAEEQGANINPATNFSNLRSPAFEPNGLIPKKYSCQGDNVSPPLVVGNLPPAVKFFSIVMEDLDAPKGVFDHWVVWNIPRRTGAIDENVSVGILGKNSDGQEEYFGPCPPNGEHRYRFTVWGYTKTLELPAGSKKPDLFNALTGRAIIAAELYGRFSAQ